jgi:hypothetical protein
MPWIHVSGGSSDCDAGASSDAGCGDGGGGGVGGAAEIEGMSLNTAALIATSVNAPLHPRQFKFLNHRLRCTTSATCGYQNA